MGLVKIDIDETLLDSLSPWLEVYNAASGDHLTRSTCHRWELHTLVLKGWEERIYRCRIPELYRVVRPVPGAQLLVKTLQRHGHRVVAVSHDYATHAAEKRAAVQRWFPSLTEIVFAKQKHSAVSGGLLIDDCHHNLPDILVSCPWNLDAGTHLYGSRAENLSHATEIALELLDLPDYRGN